MSLGNADRAARADSGTGPITSQHRGFSLIELVVAITILLVGLLAIVRSLAGLNRLLAAAASETRVAVIASSAMERMVLGGCADPVAAGDSAVGGIQVRWGGSGNRNIVIVDYPRDFYARSDTFDLARWCPP